MQFTRFALAALAAKVVSAAASPEALPWANANPQAAGAAAAYADAYAEAIAIAHPDPEAYALAASADDCASIACHAACGMLIIYGSACTSNTENQYAGPYNTTCLCSDDSDFIKQYPACMNCGWTLWKYYGGYGVVTEYTTYCPLTTTEAATSTDAATTKTTTKASTTDTTTSEAVISTFEAKAALIGSSFFGLAISFVMLF
ncbi:hypothetical protein BON22_2765 [Cyberlindnera fabianii]|uniref:Uncharacterized protein n=1 Tax=Cyberlindnera fabianii TaxID=36022 RepID=A0A1V2L7K0_CYBFA|nr:hypothetical protein BON22_2765 [Cyberlindnera fabianii]